MRTFLYICFFFSAIPLHAQIRSIQRISVDSSNQEANGASDGATINSDATVVAFRSDASNLDSRDLNSHRDVFYRDNSNSITGLASFSTSPGDGDSGNGSTGTRHVWISADGRYLSFASEASNLLGDGLDYNVVQDVFRYDRTTNQIQRINLQSSMSQAFQPSDGGPVSDDGNYIAFSTLDSTFATSDQNGASDIYLRNEQGLLSSLQSLASTTMTGNSASTDPTISGDGSIVGFTSNATDLVAGDTNGSSDIFVFVDLKGTMGRISAASDGTQGNANSTQPFMSSSGQYVVFSSLASNLVAGDTLGVQDIFLRDRFSDEVERISVGRLGQEANGASSMASISSDGRYVAFLSDASNLVKGDSNETTDAFVYDRQTSETLRVNLNTKGKQGKAAVTDLQISADGKWVVFSTADSTLLTDTNGVSDVFLVEINPVLTPDTTIDEAPEVQIIEGKRRAKVIMKRFARPSLSVGGLSSSALRAENTSQAKKNIRKLNFTYKIKLTGSGSAAGDIRRLITKRNEVTFKNLRPGTYSTNYKVILNKGTRKVGQTNLSPSARFVVNR